ncbi:MAG TPA: type II secretion system ATPase GspE [Planctomycetota bacterium]|nr:type II secretion system ATPase GspE [Planctomycetota bacterium]
MAHRRKLLGAILTELGAVSHTQLQEALELQKESSVRIGDALLTLKHCTPADIARALSMQFGRRVVDPRTLDIPQEALGAVPKAMAREHHLVPIARQDGRLTVAVADPLDLYALDHLRFATNCDIEYVIAASDAIEEAIKQKYEVGDDTVDNMLQEFTESNIDFADANATELQEGDSPDDAPVIRLVTLIITEALRSRASDIHIEPMMNRLRIRYRVDGVCFEVENPPKSLQGSIISRIKIMADMDVAERRRPQDGRIRMKLLGRDIDLRVSALPASHGPSLVLRILDKQSVLLGVQDLGFGDDDYRRFKNIIKRPNGIVLVTGPTGSGKTTTLYAALNELNTPDRKIITAEDPVEYSIAGINQSEVREPIGMTFGRILRAMLRQAPNVILVGEIRDKETAEIAIQAALTGHLVFSTLHTNDAPSAIARLIDIGVQPFLVSSSVQAIMAQRLIRRICSTCKEPYEPKPHELRLVGLTQEDVAHVTLYKGTGCAECSQTGFRGRVGIFELMEMDAQIRDMAFNKATTNRIRDQAVASGMRTLLHDGVRKVLQGVTTIEEVLSNVAGDVLAEFA